MINLLGYQISQTLSEGHTSLVYRGLRQSDSQPVVLKMLKEAYPSPERIAWFKREYEVIRNLNASTLPATGVAGQALAGIVKVYSLENNHNRWIMVMEDIGGESLSRLKLAGKLALPDFLKLAIKVTDILGQIHQQHLMHKDINPSNIILNPDTGQIKIIDFGISTVLSRENPTFRNPKVLEGTLAYISPEQTGRMNRAMDYRTDFYSLGATFYELLTGRLPFPFQDALELVHCHIARQPTALSELKPEIPAVISEIVLKLMAKNAEDRYQSAYGLKADLEQYLQQTQSAGSPGGEATSGWGGEPGKSFVLGRLDISDRFQIPQKLYGRAREIEKLLAAFARVSGKMEGWGEGGKRKETENVPHSSEMMLVSGYAGIGKSALVQEVYKPITEQHGYFITGKFDQFQRNIPYSALLQAFRSLLRQLLTEGKSDIAAWQEKILAAVGPNGQVIIEVIPEVELIIGLQPPVPTLPPTEAQNRFNLVFQNFIKVFTQPEHPLVIFLDDLQWADGASLNLLELLMTAAHSEYLFLIGAYRENEVSAAHPLMIRVDEIKKAGALVNHISLAPLNLPHIIQFIADAFTVEEETARPLAELVLAKTAGNPFFMGEFLKSLYAEELVEFDTQQGGWRWQLAQIQARDMTDNVVELMAGKVQQLPAATQQVLKLAACIGNQFDLHTLAIVYEKTPSETAADLWPAISEDLILPLSDTYKLMEVELEGLSDELAVEYRFAHDRVQQAVYSLISQDDKQLAHRRVGQLLLQNTPPDKREARLFDIVNQLNQGRVLITEPLERHELAQLNLLAGRRAQASTAFQAAFTYLQIGLGLLGENSWQEQYELTLGLFVAAVEAAYLSGNFEEMEQLAQVVLQQAQTLLDTVKVYEMKIQAYHAQRKLPEGLETGLAVLKLLGMTFPKEPGPPDIMLKLQETQALMAGMQIEQLGNLPEMTDPAQLAAMRILTGLFTPAFVLNNRLVPLLICQQVSLSITYGNVPESIFAYGNYGSILCGFLGELEAGYQFGQLALHLYDRFGAKQLTGGTYIVHFNLRHWKEPLRKTLPSLLDVYQNCLDVGDLQFAVNAANTYCLISYLVGEELTKVDREMAKYAQALAQLKQATVLQWHKIHWQPVLNWLGRTENPIKFQSDLYDEEKMLPLHREQKDESALLILYFHKFILCYRFRAFQQAVENLTMLEAYLGYLAGSPGIPIVCFYESLTWLALFPQLPPAEQERIREKVAANQDNMKLWAQHAPMNYLHKYYLVEAERARILENDHDARTYYDQAIELAHAHEYLHEEALAYELAGEFYLARGQSRLAAYYLRDAHYAYRRWGAAAKVKDLETRYPEFLVQTETRAREIPILTTPTTASSETASSIFDLNSVLRASQAISGEIVLDQLLAKLMKIVIENAGAQKGFLLLEKEGRWLIEAEGKIGQAEPKAETEPEVMALPATPVEISDKLPVAVINYVTRVKEHLVLDDASREGIFSSDPYIIKNKPKSLLCMPLINQGKLTGLLYLENNLTIGAFTPDRLELLNLLSAQAAISIENARLYTHQVELTQSASRFVPQEFLQFLRKESIVTVNLGDQVQQNMTILVSDIRAFTTLSETMTPQENFDFVNAYLGRVSPIIRQHHGLIAKYMGDGMMAVFPRRVEDALNAAIAQMKAVADYNAERQQQRQAPIQIGTGIHTGTVMLGTVGEAQRMQLDLFSDAVNVAARLEGLSKLYGVPLIISTEALQQLAEPGQYHVRFLGKTPVKGRQETLSVFEVFDGDPAELSALKLETKTDFEKGLSFYHDWQFREAKAQFEQVLQRYPNDKASQFYLKRMADFAENKLPLREASPAALPEE